MRSFACRRQTSLLQPPPGLKEAEEREREQKLKAELKASRERKREQALKDGVVLPADEKDPFKRPTTAEELREFHGLGQAPLAGDYAKGMAGSPFSCSRGVFQSNE